MSYHITYVLLKNQFYFMCIGICLHVYVCTAHRRLVSKEAKTGLELELEMAVSLLLNTGPLGV